MDFAQPCIANAVTGPVMLTAHLENERKLLETVSIFDRDVAYPLACGENYLDPCVARLDREGGRRSGRGGHCDRAARIGRAPRAAATARSMSGVGSSSLGESSRARRAGAARGRAAPRGAHRRGRRGDGARSGAPRTRRGSARRRAQNAVGATSSWRVVVENDGARWNATVPCRAVARAYPDSYAIDHFSVGGASWQQNCDRLENAELMTKWVEEKTPADAKLVHDWAMSAVRFLGGPERGSAFVTRIRMHQTNGLGGRAPLMLVASSLRAGGALLNEMLETTADHPVDSKIWYREDEARADAFFATYVTLGDLWSHGLERPRAKELRRISCARTCSRRGSRGAPDDAPTRPGDVRRGDPGTRCGRAASRRARDAHAVGRGLAVQGFRVVRPERVPPERRGIVPRRRERGLRLPRTRTRRRSSNERVRRTTPRFSRLCSREASRIRRRCACAGATRTRTCLCTAPSTATRRGRSSPSHRPTPTAGSAGSEKTPGAAASVTGVWGLGDDGEKAAKTRGDDAEALMFSDGADGRASAEAFGAFGDVPGDGEDDPRRRQTHRVRFDPAVFAWLDAFETEWLDEVEAITKSAGDGRGCESLVYEDALADEARQQKTLEWLNARFALGLNVEALPLQKLRRVNTSPVTLLDFENPDALDQRARSFLREPQLLEEEDAAGETVDDYEPVGGNEKTRRLRVAFR